MPTNVASTGSMNIGADAVVNGNVTVLGRKASPTILRDRAQVFGSITLGGPLFLGNSVHVTKGVTGMKPTGAIDVISVPVTFPTTKCVDAVAPTEHCLFPPARELLQDARLLSIAHGSDERKVLCGKRVRARASIDARRGCQQRACRHLCFRHDHPSWCHKHPRKSPRELPTDEYEQNGSDDRRSDEWHGVRAVFVNRRCNGYELDPSYRRLFGNIVRIHQANILKFKPFQWGTVSDQAVPIGLVGPFRTAQEAVNSGLAKDARIYSDTGDEGAEIFFHTADGYFYTDPVVGTHTTDSSGVHYEVRPDTSQVPQGATIVGQGHSHPDGATPGPEDFNANVTIWFIDSDGTRFVVKPGSKEPVSIGKLSEDPEDGVLPPTENPPDESLDEGQFIDENGNISSVDQVIIDTATTPDTSGSNGFFGDFFSDLFG